MAGNAGHGSGSEMGLVDVFRTLRRHWWLPVAGVVLFFGAALLVVPQSTIVYRATAVVRLDDARRALTGGIEGGSPENVRSAEFMVSQVHVILSSAVLGEAVDRTGMRLQPSPELRAEALHGVVLEAYPRADTVWLRFRSGGFEARAGSETVLGTYDEPVQVAGIRFILSEHRGDNEAWLAVLSRDRAIEEVRRNLTAEPRDRAAIIDIKFTGSDHYRTQQVVNAVAEAYREHNTRGVQAAASRRREFIEGQWRLAELDHQEAQQRYAEFRSRGRLSGVQERLRSEQASLVGLDAQREQIETERRLYQAFLARVERADDEQVDAELRTLVSAPGIAAGPLLSGLYGEFSQYQTERKRLLATGRAATNPDVERLTTLMNGARASVVEAARTQLASLDLRITVLSEQRARSTSNISALPDAETDEMRLAEAVAVARSTAEFLRGEHQRARIAEAVDVGQAEILDFASGATPHRQGRRAQKLFLSLMFGLMVGSGGALVREATNPAVRWGGELETLISIPELGVIPDLQRAAPSVRRRQSPGAAALNGQNGTNEGIGGNGKQSKADSRANGRNEKPGANRRVLPAANFHTPAAEAYRVLRTNLVFYRGNEKLTTIAVVSAASGEGKSTTAVNLAVAYARQDLRVLLVDCDLRQPSLHRMLGAKAVPGFLDVLAGRATVGTAVQETSFNGLSLLPRGTFDERAVELLDSQRTDVIISSLKDRFDMVIFDTAPVLAAADTAMLAPRVDGVLLVVRAGRTPRAAALHAKQQLQAVGASVIGFVLNDPETVTHQYDVYSYSKDYYAVES